MPNTYQGTGNLGDSPAIKTVQVNGEDRKVAELRVFFDNYRSDGQGGVEQSGGLWMDVSLWDYKAEQAARLLRKGKRLPVPPTQSGMNQVLTDSRNGSSSSIWLFGQVGSFSSVSRSHAAGSRPLSRAVPIRL